MSACQQWRDKLEVYIDGELDAAADSQLATHLRGCSACNAVVVDILRQKRATRSAGMRYQANADLRRKVMTQTTRSEGRVSFRAWAFSTAAVLVLVAVVFVSRANFGGQREMALRALADLHTTALAAAAPVEVVSSDNHTVKPWFQGKVPFSFDLPEPGTGPYILLGGRMAYIAQQPAAQLLFTYKQHRISAFIVAEQPEMKSWNGSNDLSGIHVESWSHNGLRYVVVGDAGPEVLHGLAEWIQQKSTSATEMQKR